MSLLCRVVGAVVVMLHVARGRAGAVVSSGFGVRPRGLGGEGDGWRHFDAKPGAAAATAAIGVALLRRGIGDIARFTRLAVVSLALILATGLALVPAAQATTFGSQGTGSGEFQLPHGDAVDQATGDVYVVDLQNQRVDKFDGRGNFVMAFGWGVADGSTAALQTCTTTCFPGLSGSGSGEFSFPSSGIAVDPSTGDVYVVDRGNRRVEEFDSSGNFILMFGGDVDKTTGANVCTASSGDTCGSGTTGTANGQFTPHQTNVPGAGADIAVGATGTVYVGDLGRVQEFSSSGSYTGQITLPSSSDQVTALAVNSVGDVYAVSGQESAGNASWIWTAGVREFDPAGTLLDTLDASGTPLALTVDGSDDVFVYDAAQGGEFLKYDSTGVEIGSYPDPGAVPVDLGYATAGEGGLAYDDASDLLYASDFAHNDVLVLATPPGPFLQPGSEQASGVLSTTAALAAGIDPEGNATSFHFDYGTAAAYGQSTPESASIGSDFAFHSASANLSGLQPDTLYHFRIVATNSAGTASGPDETFRTLPALLIDPQPPTALTPTSATLDSYLDPTGLGASYHFEYGTSTAYGSSTPTVDLAAASTPQAISAAVSGLAADTTYHFRLVATDSLGTLHAPDSTFTTPPASCPNAALRIGAAAQLPDCRAYEQVSPADKAGYGVGQAVVSPSGDRALFITHGVFAGEPTSPGDDLYLARRGPDGWQTTGIDAPTGLGYSPSGNTMSAALPDLSAFMTQPLMPGTSASTATLAGTSATIFARHDDGSFTPGSPVLQRVDGLALANGASPPLQVCGASVDLSHLVVCASDSLVSSDTAPHLDQRLYDVVGANTASPSLELASVDSAGNPFLECNNFDLVLGNPSDVLRAGHAVSSDGSKIFFEAQAAGVSGGCNGGPEANMELLARVNDQTTVDLSYPQPNDECTTVACQGAPPSGANYEGAAADGSKVFFLSPRQLTDTASEDPNTKDSAVANQGCRNGPQGPNGCNLYEYDFGRPAGHNLVALSAGDTSGLGPEVRGVVGVSDDGSHVYFIASGVLTGSANALGETARPGADNLYVADTTTGTVAFIAALCSGQGMSGQVADAARCPSSGNDLSLLLLGEGESDVTPDGRDLVFTSYGRLTPDDTNAAADVYEYDAQTQALVRLSVGHDGQDDNGNGGNQDAQVQPVLGAGTPIPFSADEHVVSADGQTVVFTTARALQTGDVNGQQDVYEWHQGEVTLISGGQSPTGSPNGLTGASISPSGNDIVFDTEQGLLPQDTDGLLDIYDARVGGGFPPPPVTTAPCAGDGCRGPVANAPAAPTLATIAFGPGNPLAPPAIASVRVLSRSLHGSTFRLTIMVPGPGRITVAGAGVRRTVRAVAGAGTYGIGMRLTAGAARALRHRRSERLRLRVSWAPSRGAASATTISLTVKA